MSLLRASITVKCIFIFLLCIFFPKSSFAEGAAGLSGKYRRYNVVLIILDALRPDHLSCYGYAKPTSPNIDALAKEGILFTNAFSQASITLPSVTSIFTSVYPYSHGVTHILKDRVPDKLSTLAQMLNTYGYNTVWFGKLDDPHSGSAPGLLKGFNAKNNLSPLNILEDNQKIFRWIRDYRKEPFFITIHSYSVHEGFFPYMRFDNEFSRNIPKEFLALMDSLDKRCWDKLQDMLKYEPEKIIDVLGEDWVKKNLRQEYFPGAFGKLYAFVPTQEKKIILDRTRTESTISLYKSLNKDQLAYFLSILDSAVYEIDKDMVKGLISELKEFNLYDKTIIIITADHGNLYSEHGKFGHGIYLYDEVMHVPLIMYLPNLKKGRMVKELAQSIDILPTTLDLLSIPIPHQAQGISLVGLMEGKKNALTHDYVFCQPNGTTLGPFAIRSKYWKLIQKNIEDKEKTDINSDTLDKIEFRLFNLQKDPQELHNLIIEKPKVAIALKKRLDSWMASLVIYQNGQDDFTPGLSEETKERIKKTGYW